MPRASIVTAPDGAARPGGPISVIVSPVTRMSPGSARCARASSRRPPRMIVTVPDGTVMKAPRLETMWQYTRGHANRVSPHAVLEPHRPAALADHRRGDRGGRGRLAHGLRVGLDRPALALAPDRVAAALPHA